MLNEDIKIDNLKVIGYKKEEKRKQILSLIQEFTDIKDIRKSFQENGISDCLKLNSLFLQLNYIYNTKIHYSLFLITDSVNEVIDYILDEGLIVMKRGLNYDLYY